MNIFVIIFAIISIGLFLNIGMSVYILYTIKKHLFEKISNIETLLNKVINIMEGIASKMIEIDVSTEDLNYIITLNNKIILKYKQDLETLKHSINNLTMEDLNKILHEMENLESYIKTMQNNLSILSDLLEDEKWTI